jgi:ferredoxin-type protein NapF
MAHFLCRRLTRLWARRRPGTISCREARPPWAIEESQFLTLCQRCGNCFQACPNGLIKPAAGPEYQDSPIAGTPVLDLDCGQCSYCGSCARACPSGALDLRYGRQVQTRVRIETSCQARQGFYCLLCEDACPQQAIKASPDGVTVNMAACDGCGACGLACLYGAISLVRQP